MALRDFFIKKKKNVVPDYIIPEGERDEYIKSREAADSAKKQGKANSNGDAMLYAKGSKVSGDLNGGINNAVGKVSGGKF